MTPSTSVGNDTPTIATRSLSRVVPHSGACGERIPSPHPRCQAKADPYLVAERFMSRWGTSVVRCNGCGKVQAA